MYVCMYVYVYIYIYIYIYVNPNRGGRLRQGGDRGEPHLRLMDVCIM